MSYATLRGSALDAQEHAITGLSLRLGTVRGHRFHLLEEITPSAAGAFVCTTDLSELGSTRCQFLAAHDGRLVQITAGETTFRADQAPEHIVLTVDPYLPQAPVQDPPAQPATSHSVRGRVTHTDGTELSGLLVKAVQREVDGSTTQLTLSSAPAEATTASDGGYAIGYDGPTTRLGVEVEDASVVIATGKVDRAGAHEILNVLVEDDAYAAPPEFTRIEAAVDPGQTGLVEGRDWSTVGDEGIDMLAREHGLDEAAVRAFRDAFLLVPDVPSVAPEVLFGLLRRGVGASAEALTRTGASLLERHLESAAERNEVSAAVGAAAATHAAALRAERITRSLAGLGVGALGPWLDNLDLPTALTGAQKQEFAQLFHDHIGALSAFWSALVNNVNFTAAERTALRRAVGIRSWGLDNPPLMQAIDAEFAGSTIEAVAAFTDAQWSQVLGNTTHSPPIPSSMPGPDPAASYREHLRRQGELAYPSAVVRQRMLDDLSPSSLVHIYLTANAQHDFRARVTSAMTTGSSDPVQLESDLKLYQRLYLIGPDFERYAALKEANANGLVSAWAIVRLGSERFRSTMSVAADVADTMLRRARGRHAAATAVMMQLLPGRTGFTDAQTHTIEAVTADAEANALFGSLGVCSCRECRSLISPAAYLVDLLDWLRATNQYSKLTARRPDIPKLLLSCENTNTALPYVDLVLEIFEAAVAPPPAGTPPHDTGGASSEQLQANPRYVNNAAYEAVRTATYPPSAPFDFFTAQADAFLELVGVSRPELMEAFQTTVGPPVPTDDEISGARLGLGPTGISALIGDVSADALWGGPAGGPAAVFNATGGVAKMRKGLRVSREGLLDLMEVRFWNPSQAFQLSPLTECDPDQTAMVGSPVDGDYERLMRFVRGMLATGWTWLELDKVIASLGWSDLDAAQVGELSRLRALQDEAGLSVVELLSLWAALDTREDRATEEEPEVPLYDALFLSQDNQANLYADDGGGHLRAGGRDVCAQWHPHGARGLHRAVRGPPRRGAGRARRRRRAGARGAGRRGRRAAEADARHAVGGRAPGPARARPRADGAAAPGAAGPRAPAGRGLRRVHRGVLHRRPPQHPRDGHHGCRHRRGRPGGVRRCGLAAADRDGLAPGHAPHRLHHPGTGQ